MTFEQLIQRAMPEADAATIDYVLWNRTPFPFDGDPKKLYKLAVGYKRACKNGIELCEFCPRPAVDGWNCERCNAALTAAKHTGD